MTVVRRAVRMAVAVMAEARISVDTQEHAAAAPGVTVSANK